MEKTTNFTEQVGAGAGQSRGQQTHSALSQFYSSSPLGGPDLNGTALAALGESTTAPRQQSMRGSPAAGARGANGTLSPLELIDHTADDESLLQALEGLTLDLEAEAKASETGFDQAGPAKLGGGEPKGEHGTRSEFIKDVSEKLITRVNAEAGDIEQAKLLMHQYMLEFCAEYDRCGYGAKYDSRSDQSSSFAGRTQSTNQLSSASSQVLDKKHGKPQLEFDNQILKKGVRVLSKNLQKAHEQSRVKDQQLKVMRNFLVHQNQQITALKDQLAQLQKQLPADVIETQKMGHQPRGAAEARTIQQLHLSSQAQPDSAMAGTEPVSQQVQGSAADAANQVNEHLQQRSLMSRALQLQSMKTIEHFQRGGDQSKPDIY